MKIAIMQPYFFPYLGYFQLINAVDKFVIYDNIEFTKRGWINRNRILVNGKDAHFTIPLKKASDYNLVIEREVAENYVKEIGKIINKIEASYIKAPYFNEVFPMVKSIFLYDEINLFNYIQHSLISILNYLEIRTEIIVASTIDINHSLRSQDKVLAICEQLNADNYINPIGGKMLYSKNTFSDHNISLSFLQSDQLIYKQFDNDFIPWLSIIDIMMFNNLKEIKIFLNLYSIK